MTTTNWEFLRQTAVWIQQRALNLTNYSVSSAVDYSLGFSENTREIPALIDFLQANRFSKLIGIYRCALIQVLVKDVLDAASPKKQDFDELCQKYPSYRLQLLPFGELLGLSKPGTPAVEPDSLNVVYVPQIPFVDKLLEYFSHINFNQCFDEASFKAEPALVVRIKRVYNLMLKLEEVLVLVEENRYTALIWYSQIQNILTDLFNLDIDVLPLFMAQLPQLKEVYDACVRLTGMSEDENMSELMQQWTSQEQVAEIGSWGGFWLGLLFSQSHEKYQSLTTLRGGYTALYQSIDVISEVCEDWSKNLSITLHATPTYAEEELTKKLQLSTSNFLKEDEKVSNLLGQLFKEDFVEKLRGYQGEITQHFSDILPALNSGNLAPKMPGFDLSSFFNLKKLQQVISLIKLVCKHVSELHAHTKTLKGNYNDVILLLLMHLKYDVLLSVVSYVDVLQNRFFLKSGDSNIGLGGTDAVEIYIQQLYGTIVVSISSICDFSENPHLAVLFDETWIAKRQELDLRSMPHVHGEKLELEIVQEKFLEFKDFLRSWTSLLDSLDGENSFSVYKPPIDPLAFERGKQSFVMSYPLIQKYYPDLADNMRDALQNSSNLLELPNDLSLVDNHIAQTFAHYELQKQVLHDFSEELTNLNQSSLFFLELPKSENVTDSTLFKMMTSTYAIFKLDESYKFLNKLSQRSHLIPENQYDELAKICEKFFNKPWVLFCFKACEKFFNKPGVLFRFKADDCQKLLKLFAPQLTDFLGTAQDFSGNIAQAEDAATLNDIDAALVLRQGRFGQEERIFKHDMLKITELIQAIEKKALMQASQNGDALNLLDFRQQLRWDSIPKVPRDKLSAALGKEYAPQAKSIASLLEYLKTKLVAKLLNSEDSNIFDAFVGSSYEQMRSLIESAKLIKTFSGNYADDELSEIDLLDVFNVYESKLTQLHYYHKYARSWFETLEQLSRTKDTFKDLSRVEYAELMHLFATAKPILKLAYDKSAWSTLIKDMLKKKTLTLISLTLKKEECDNAIQAFKSRLESQKQRILAAYQTKVSIRAGNPNSLAAIAKDERLGKILRHDNYSKVITKLMALFRTTLVPHFSPEIQAKLVLANDEAFYPIDLNLGSVYKLPKQVADLMWAYNSLYRLREFAREMEAATGTKGVLNLQSQCVLIQKYFAFQSLFFFFRPSAQPVFNLMNNGNSRIIGSKWMLRESWETVASQFSILLEKYSLEEPLDGSNKTLLKQANIQSQNWINSFVHSIFIAPVCLKHYKEQRLLEPAALEKYSLEEPLDGSNKALLKPANIQSQNWINSFVHSIFIAPVCLKHYQEQRLLEPAADEMHSLKDKHLQIAKRVDSVLHPTWHWLFELPNLAYCVFDAHALIQQMLTSTKALTYDNFKLIRAEIFKIYTVVEATEIDLGLKENSILPVVENLLEAFTQKLLQTMRVPLVDYIDLISKQGAYIKRRENLENELEALGEDAATLNDALNKMQQFLALPTLEEKVACLQGVYRLIETYCSVRPGSADLREELYRSNPKKLQDILAQDALLKKHYDENRTEWENSDSIPRPENFGFPNHFLEFSKLVEDNIVGRLESVRLSIDIHQHRIARLNHKIAYSNVADETTLIDAVSKYYEGEKSALIAAHVQKFKDFPLLQQQYIDKLTAHFSGKFQQDAIQAAAKKIKDAETILRSRITEHAKIFDKQQGLDFEKKRLILEKIKDFKAYLDNLPIDALTENKSSIAIKLAFLNTLEDNLLNSDYKLDECVNQIKGSYTLLTDMGVGASDSWVRTLLQYIVCLLEWVGLYKSHRHSFFYALQDTATSNLRDENIFDESVFNPLTPIKLKEHLANHFN